VSLDESFEAADVNTDLFAALLEVSARVSRNDRPVTFVALAWIEAVLPFTGLSVIRTPNSLHVASQRLAKAKSRFIAVNRLILFALHGSQDLRCVPPDSKPGNACRS
jgi:hypothetical protein